jgi:hypothetical protein
MRTEINSHRRPFGVTEINAVVRRCPIHDTWSRGEEKSGDAAALSDGGGDVPRIVSGIRIVLFQVVIICIINDGCAEERGSEEHTGTSGEHNGRLLPCEDFLLPCCYSSSRAIEEDRWSNSRERPLEWSEPRSVRREDKQVLPLIEYCSSNRLQCRDAPLV